VAMKIPGCWVSVKRSGIKPIMLIVLFLVSHVNFLFVSCGRLSFLVHFKYTLSYRTVLLLLPAGHAGIVFTQWSKNGFFRLARDTLPQ